MLPERRKGVTTMRQRGCVEIQSLESHVLLAATPEQVLTTPMRKALLDGLALTESRHASLRHKLRMQDDAAFDQQLLDYMVNRDRGLFLRLRRRTISDYANYINDNLNAGADVLPRADKIMDNLYPSRTAPRTTPSPSPRTSIGTTRATPRTPRRCTRSTATRTGSIWRWPTG